MKASFPASFSSHLPLEGALTQTRPPLSCRPPCLSVLACCLLPGPELRGSPRRPQPREKNIQMGGNRRVFCFLLQEKARLFLAPFSTNQIFSFFLSQSPVSGRLQAGEQTLELAFWIPLHFCSVSVLFLFLCLAVSLVSGLLTSFRRCSQAKESKKKPSSRMGSFGWREREGQKGSIPQSGSGCGPSAFTHSPTFSN